MCNCFDTSDVICFFTFFITVIVALLFVQYFFVYLESDIDDKEVLYLSRCGYFLLLTFLGCIVFAGVQRRSICLLKWPSRILVVLLIIGLITLTTLLWVTDRIHKQSIRDLEEKSAKLLFVIFLLLTYGWGVQKLVTEIRSSLPTSITLGQRGMMSLNTSDHMNHPSTLIDLYRSERLKKTERSQQQRQINVASNGINYYKVLLEGAQVNFPPADNCAHGNEAGHSHTRSVKKISQNFLVESHGHRVEGAVDV